MGYAAWPTGVDLHTMLSDTGFDSSTLSSTLDTYADAARFDFERVTGRQPFLATAQTRLFNPPGPNDRKTRSNVLPMMGGGRRLHLDNGLVTLTSLRVGITIDNPTGTLYTQNRDFWLRPQNAPSEYRPWDLVEFLNPQYGQFSSIQIVGTWGWQATIPEDAWMAVLYRAALKLGPILTGSKTGGVTKVTLGPNSFDFGAKGAYGNEMAMWKTTWLNTIAQYARVDV